MIQAFIPLENRMARRLSPADAIPAEAAWLDLVNPTPEEIEAVETLCGIDIPTPEEMREIEVSSRLYSEDGADFMTVAVLYGLDDGRPAFAPVTFMLTRERLITLRYSEPKSFMIFAARLCQDPSIAGILKENAKPLPGSVSAMPAAGTERQNGLAERLLIGLLETIVDRMADLLETISADLDKIADDIFSSSASKKPTGTDDFKKLLQRIGAAGDLTSRVREALATFDRLMPFLQLALDSRGKGMKDARAHIKIMTRDVHSLNDFVAFLSNKTTFLLDTTVGMISIEQNGIIKIFSVASVAFLPPTLIASIYGMNFQYMPELSWSFGYPMAVCAMVLSAVVPMLFFRMKGWF